MQEFEDHFEDEIDFTPPAEDTPSMQSPAEVYTLAVSPVALPGPPHLQPPGRITGRTHALSETRRQRSDIETVFCCFLVSQRDLPGFRLHATTSATFKKLAMAGSDRYACVCSIPPILITFPLWSSGNMCLCLVCLCYNRLF